MYIEITDAQRLMKFCLRLIFLNTTGFYFNNFYQQNVKNICVSNFCINLFVCVEVLWPSQPNGVMSSTVNLPNHTFAGQA